MHLYLPIIYLDNAGISSGFQPVHFKELTFPGTMLVDYVRVYQAPNKERVSCDPPDYPTAKYIADHADLYYNPNHTSFPHGQFKWPKNRLLHSC